MTDSAQSTMAQSRQNRRGLRRQLRLGSAKATAVAWRTAVEQMTANLDSLEKQLSSSAAQGREGGGGRVGAWLRFRQEARRNRITGHINGARVKLEEVGRELEQLDQLLSRASEAGPGGGSLLNDLRDLRREAGSRRTRARSEAFRHNLQARQATAEALMQLLESLPSRGERESSGGSRDQQSASREGSSGTSGGQQADRETIVRAIEQLVEEDDPRQPSTQAVNQLLKRQGYDTPVNEEQISAAYRDWQRGRR